MSNRYGAAPHRNALEGRPKAGEPTSTVAHRSDSYEQLDIVTLLAGPPTVGERFRAFHENNQHVYDALVSLTREFLSRTGRSKVGIAAVYERARWELTLQTTETPRLNNSYQAWYARMIMEREPDLAGVFQLRTSAADRSTDRMSDGKPMASAMATDGNLPSSRADKSARDADPHHAARRYAGSDE